MQRHTNGSLVWLTFDLFAAFPQLVHGVFLRHGGVSTGDFAALNFGYTQGDKIENVEQNLKMALDALHLPHTCSLYQSHSNTIVQASPLKKERGDGLTTSQKNLGLKVQHADCQAAIFYDPVHHAVANVHCGWRGNVQNIYQKTIEAMRSLYASKPADLLIGISPSLGPEASEFINYKVELPEVFYPFQIKPLYFDLWEISRWQLLECGILPQHIEIAQICTYANPDDYFSYRRLKVSGRHATIAALL